MDGTVIPGDLGEWGVLGADGHGIELQGPQGASLPIFASPVHWFLAFGCTLELGGGRFENPDV